MKVAELEAELSRGNLALVYWVTGEEDYLRDVAVARLKRAVLSGTGQNDESQAGSETDSGLNEFNDIVFYGDEAEGAEILAAAREAPIFSSRRIVIVKAADKLSARDTEGLLPYLKDPCDSTTLVFVSHKLDGRLKFTQALKERSRVVDCAPLPDFQLESWIRGEGNRLGLRLTDDAIALLRELAGSAGGTALYLVRHELEKLVLYVPQGQAAGPADVETIRGGFPGASVFDLTLAITKADRARALRILGRNLESGEAPLRILGSLIWQYRRIWKAKDLLEEGRSDAELARALAISPYRLRDLLSQARQFSTAHLRHAFDLLLKTDSALKGGSGGAAGRVLEGLLLELCAELHAATHARPVQSQAPSLPRRAERKGGTPISNVRTIRSGKTPAH